MNQLPLSENALKLTYGSIELQNFPVEDSPLKGREREGGRSGREKKGWDGREGDGEVGRERVERKG
jgi:hypothetical protein